MTGRQRLTATLRGEAVDRPALSFYEVGGFEVDPRDPDLFNIYNSPSWQPLLRLAEERTDLIRMRSPALKLSPKSRADEFFSTDSYIEQGSQFTRTRVNIGGKILTSLTRRDPDVYTVWTLEHLLKDVEDLRTYLELPDEALARDSEVSDIITCEQALGERGIVMLDTGDPLCAAAQLFSMEDYTIIALTEPELFHALLAKMARWLLPVIESTASQLPGHLWRICGPEYACEPYLPPRLFDEYVVGYTGPIVKIIKKHEGFARIHCHGRIKSVLPRLVEMGADATDPIEPPPQGNVELADVRRDYGNDLVLFGNLEIADIENMEPSQFASVVRKSLADGTSGSGRGFVLMPSASPYGRVITETTMANYETMVRIVEGFHA